MLPLPLYASQILWLITVHFGSTGGQKRTKEIAEKAGFTKFRQATRTPFYIIYEAKPWRFPNMQEDAMLK